MGWGLATFFAVLWAFPSFGGYCEAPRVTDPAAGCCNYRLRGSTVRPNEVFSEIYEQPTGVFGDEAAALHFVRGLSPQGVFYEPFDDRSVRVVQGWHYTAGGFHAAVDYAKGKIMPGEDPSFLVRAIAEGRVVSVFWDDWLGNTLILEHQARGGTRYRSVYCHLRNGRQTDLSRARAISLKHRSGAPASPNWKKYKAFADLSHTDARYWGTEEQKIRVKEGETVSSKQIIAWAGNTGAGGAGNGLDEGGKPKNQAHANVHLHISFAVENPKRPHGWLFIDPYGEYSKASEKCYNALKEGKPS